MAKIDQILEELNDGEKEIIRKAKTPGSIILFNIKGMIQVLHEKGPFDFVEMGYEDIEHLKEKGLITTIRGMEESNVLQGEEYTLSPLGHKVSQLLDP